MATKSTLRASDLITRHLAAKNDTFLWMMLKSAGITSEAGPNHSLVILGTKIIPYEEDGVLKERSEYRANLYLTHDHRFAVWNLDEITVHPTTPDSVLDLA